MANLYGRGTFLEEKDDMKFGMSLGWSQWCGVESHFSLTTNRGGNPLKGRGLKGQGKGCCGRVRGGEPGAERWSRLEILEPGGPLPLGAHSAEPPSEPRTHRVQHYSE